MVEEKNDKPEFFSRHTKKIMQPDVSKEEMEIVQDHSSKI